MAALRLLLVGIGCVRVRREHCARTSPRQTNLLKVFGRWQSYTGFCRSPNFHPRRDAVSRLLTPPPNAYRLTSPGRLKKDGGVKFNNTVALTRLGDDPAATVGKARFAALASRYLLCSCFCDADTRPSTSIFPPKTCFWCPLRPQGPDRAFLLPVSAEAAFAMLLACSCPWILLSCRR